MSKIKNYTGHPVNVITDGGLITFPPDSKLTVNNRVEQCGKLFAEGLNATIPVLEYKTDTDGIKPPRRQKGTVYIVSQITASGFRDRADFYVIGPNIRSGRTVIGTRGLIQNPFLDTKTNNND